MAEVTNITEEFQRTTSEKQTEQTPPSTETQSQMQSNAEEGEIKNTNSLDNEDKKPPSLEKKKSTKQMVINALTNFVQKLDQRASQEEEEKLLIPNQCTIRNLTYDIQKDLITLQKKYPQYQPLVYRKWKSRNLRIMQFNMCADGLSGIYNKIPDEKTFLGIDKRCLEWTYRGLKIIEAILQYDCDVICLQECDAMEFFGRYLDQYGYSWLFQPKNESPIKNVCEQIQKERNDNNITMNLDGVAIIYKKDKLKRNGDPIHIDMSKNKEKINALAAPFTFKPHSKSNVEIDLLVIVTHPKSTKNEEGEKLRERQLKSLLTDLIPSEQFENKFIILGCDLNSAPVFHEKNKAPLCYKYVTDEYQFQSCYKLFSPVNEEPEFTTLKKREGGVAKHCLDYIFVKNNIDHIDFDVVGCLDIPAEIDENNNPRLLPNWYYPSDHFVLVSEISFSAKQQK